MRHAVIVMAVVVGGFLGCQDRAKSEEAKCHPWAVRNHGYGAALNHRYGWCQPIVGVLSCGNPGSVTAVAYYPGNVVALRVGCDQ